MARTDEPNRDGECLAAQVARDKLPLPVGKMHSCAIAALCGDVGAGKGAMMRGRAIATFALGLFAAAAGADEALDRQLIEAVSDARHRVRELLDKGASTEAKGYYDTTPLITVAIAGDLDTVELLLERGARVDAENGLGQTPLTVRMSHRALVERLLKAGADINRPNKNGVVPLMVAAEGTGSEMVSLLLARGADARRRNSAGEGVLEQALRNLDKKQIEPLFRVLLEAGAPMDTHDFTGQPLFVSTIVARQEGVARMLLHRGADPWVMGSGGEGALDAAVSDGDVDDGVMRLLLSLRPSKATLNHAIHTAARNDNLKAVLWLRNAGAELESMRGGDTLLGTAIHGQAWTVTRELLRLGVSANAPASAGLKPLEVAMAKNDIEMVRLLLRSGADPNGAGQEGEPLIRAAILTENPEMLELMFIAGANKNVEISGTPLKKIASHWEDPRMVAAFKKRPSPQARAESGLVPFDDDGLFRAIVGDWKDADGYFDMTFRHDGTYTGIYSFLGLTKTETGFWSVSQGDLVIDQRASRDLAPAIMARPIVRLKNGTMVLRWGNESTEWRKAGPAQGK